MFADEIKTFKNMLLAISKRLEDVEKNQQSILDKITEVDLVNKHSNKQFTCCWETFNQIKQVSEALVEKMDEFGGTITEQTWNQ